MSLSVVAMETSCAAGGRPSESKVAAVEAAASADPVSISSPALTVVTDYFPAWLSVPSVRCEEGGKLLPVVSETQAQHWARHLAASGEAPLAPRAGVVRAAGLATIRFTWLRSFHPAVVVRIETEPDGGQRVVAKRLSGSGGYRPGKVEARVERPLSGDEMRVLRILLERRRPFDLAPDVCTFGMDGADWIFESVDDGGYHFVERWTPSKGPAYALGRFLMGLTGWELDPIY